MNSLTTIIKKGEREFEEKFPIDIECTKHWGCDNCGACYDRDIRRDKAIKYISERERALLEGLKKMYEGMKRGGAFLASPVTQKDCEARDNYFYNLALSQVIQSLEESITYLKTKI